MNYTAEYYKLRCEQLQKDAEILQNFLDEGVLDILSNLGMGMVNAADRYTQGKFSSAVASGAQNLSKKLSNIGKDFKARAPQFEYDRMANEIHQSRVINHLTYHILPNIDRVKTFMESLATYRHRIPSEEEVKAKIPKTKLKKVDSSAEYDALYEPAFQKLREKAVQEQKKLIPSHILGWIASEISSASEADMDYRRNSAGYVPKNSTGARVEGVEQQHGGHWMYDPNGPRANKVRLHISSMAYTMPDNYGIIHPSVMAYHNWHEEHGSKLNAPSASDLFGDQRTYHVDERYESMLPKDLQKVNRQNRENFNVAERRAMEIMQGFAPEIQRRTEQEGAERFTRSRVAMTGLPESYLNKKNSFLTEKIKKFMKEQKTLDQLEMERAAMNPQENETPEERRNREANEEDTRRREMTRDAMNPQNRKEMNQTLLNRGYNNPTGPMTQDEVIPDLNALNPFSERYKVIDALLRGVKKIDNKLLSIVDQPSGSVFDPNYQDSTTRTSERDRPFSTPAERTAMDSENNPFGDEDIQVATKSK